MDHRRLGQSDLLTSVIGLGCNKLLDPENADMVAVAHNALDLGINHFDGADVYGSGKCETFFGKVLKGRRDQALIVSKFGMIRNPDGRGVTVDVTPGYVTKACDASLQRLGTDHIDLYYQHRMDEAVPIEDTVGAMARLVEAGKVRALGLSNTTPELIRRAHATHPIAAVQMEYSLMQRGVEAEILPTCKELGISFVAYGPLTFAFLGNAIKSANDIPADDGYRRRQSRFADGNIDHNLQMLSVLNGIADEVGATPGQVALAWTMVRGYDVIPIPGSSRPQHLAENAAALDVTLMPDQVARLDAAFAPGAAKGDTTPVG